VSYLTLAEPHRPTFNGLMTHSFSSELDGFLTQRWTVLDLSQSATAFDAEQAPLIRQNARDMASSEKAAGYVTEDS
jgi:hypothetical protein